MIKFTNNNRQDCKGGEAKLRCIKRKGKKVFVKLGVVYASIIILLNVLGVGYGSWKSDIVASNTITTGNLNAVFVVNPVTTGTVQYVIFNDSLTITIDGVEAGSTQVINYSVKNNGTIPIKLKDGTTPYANITNKVGSNTIAPGETGEGTIYIENVKAEGAKEFLVNLDFDQFNMQ